MDLNYLYARHQISLMRVGQAASPEARCAHAALALAYADRIRDLQQVLRATVAPLLR